MLVELSTVASHSPFAFVFPAASLIVIAESFKRLCGIAVVMTMGETPVPVLFEMAKLALHELSKAL